MKKLVALVLTLCAMLTLTGCSGKYPERAADGSAWNRDWTILGTVLGVEEPGNGLTLSENPVVLTGDDTHYATWTIGEAAAYTNEDGKETELYDAQLYLLLYGCADEAGADEAVADWIEREQEVYQITDVVSENCNGQAYTVMLYEVGSDTNPYARGAVAFGVYENYAVSAELTCVDSFTGDAHEILTVFLNGCHYSAELN